jgi:hypothetical protein
MTLHDINPSKMFLFFRIERANPIEKPLRRTECKLLILRVPMAGLEPARGFRPNGF